MRLILPLIALVCLPFTMAGAMADTLKVNVTVEVILPDSSRVAKTVQTAVPASTARPATIVPQVEIVPVAPMAQSAPTDSALIPEIAEHRALPDTVVADTVQPLLAVATPYVKPLSPDPARVRFSWGAELASSIDLSGHDMSSIDFNAYFGLRYKWLDFAGIGAGANIMVSNSCRTYPVFAVVRSDFSRFKKIMFLDLRGGLALNYLPENMSQRAPYASLSVGFNLARSSKFRSYILAGYTYIGRKDIVTEQRTHEYPSLSMASIRLGVAF